MNNIYKHAEAFCLMHYQCESCGHKQIIWNARDGVTPFTTSCEKCGKASNHIKFDEDKRVPDHILKPGDLYFDDLKLKEYIPLTIKRLNQFNGTEYEVPEGKKYKKAVDLASEEWYKGMPALKVAQAVISPWIGQPGILAMPLLSNVAIGHSGWEIVKCPICGEECWKRPEQEQLEAKGVKAACTMCALRSQ